MLDDPPLTARIFLFPGCIILAKVSYLVPLFRKIATILLLTFLFFNWVGYWLFISWFESRETAHWVARLDSDQYNADQLIVLKVSAEGIPYSNPSTTFERADGEIEIGTIHYRYVRKRLYNDSLEFLCVPDRENSRLRTAKNDLLRLVTDIPDTGGHGKSPARGKTVQLLLKAYWEDSPSFDVSHRTLRATSAGSGSEAAVCPGHTRVGKQPPKMRPFFHTPVSQIV